ncbi:MAG: hypothetical protein HN842_07835 [Gammaproteobacteria bacterium]|jgi:hypothetical protein|nr:hypothetical protein [Gammaproteobacteria bacterium]
MILLMMVYLAGEVDLLWDPPGNIGLIIAFVACSAAMAADTALWWWLYRLVRDWIRR